MHDDDEYVVNVLPALKLIIAGLLALYTWLIANLIFQYRDIQYQKTNYDFFGCNFNVTYIREAEGVTALVKTQYIRTRCHNWKGVNSQQTIQQGDLGEIDPYYYVGVAILTVLLFLGHRTWFSGSSDD